MELGKSRGWIALLYLLGFLVVLLIVAAIAANLMGGWIHFWRPWGKHCVVISILALVTVLAHLLMKWWASFTVTAPHQTPPTAQPVTDVTPAAGATSVAVAGSIVATFAEEINSSTLNATKTFTLAKQGTNVPVPAAVTYNDPAPNRASLRPTAPLDAAATYTATIRGGADGVKNLMGNPLPADKKWSFATATTLPHTVPAVTSSSPVGDASRVDASDTIQLTFSEEMDPQTINSSDTFILVKQGVGAPVPAQVTYDSVSKKATLDPDAPLDAGSTYTATVMSGANGVKNLVGNSLAANSTWSFMTARNLGFWKLCVGKDGRGSLSKTQVLVWTYVFFFAVLWLVVWQPGNFEDVWVNLQPEYLILLGSPAAAALLAKKFTSDHVEEQTVVQPPATNPPTLQTAATETITTNDGQADLFNFQYALFNLLAILFFFSQFLFHPARGLPHLPETLVALTGLSAAGYAAKKGWETSGQPSISSVTPSLLLFGRDEQMTITGVNFGEPDKGSPRQNSVLLKGRPLGTVSQWDPERIVATIPRNPAELGISVPAGTESSSADIQVQDRFGRKSGAATVTLTLATPTISVVDPVNGAMGIAPNTTVEATFSEEIDKASIEASGAFTLKQQDAAAPWNAAVIYDPASNMATLRPGEPLNPGTTYTATVNGGVDGVKNLAGNPLALDRTWSFTTR
jgi:hypothetical protein